MLNYSEDSSDFVCLNDRMPDCIYDVRYHSSYNFIGEPIDGYDEPLALLTREAFSALQKVNEDLRQKGYGLKIYDAYRPQKAVDHFVRWAKDLSATRMKNIFYPDVDKAKLFECGYIAANSSHTRGSTVDLTLFDLPGGKDLDMGGVFDDFSQRSHPDYQDITEEQSANRLMLSETMKAYGFVPIETEWWHYTLANEPYPDTYFTFEIRKDILDKEK